MKNFWKWLSIPILGITLAVCTNSAQEIHRVVAEEQLNITPTQISAPRSTIISVQNYALGKTLRTILGKGEKDPFYAEDFLNHPDFKATTTTDEETGVSTTTAKTYQLDLSNTGVQDIRELCQFIFPSTLQGINLAGNGITTLSSLLSFLDSTPTSVDPVTGDTIHNTLLVGDRSLAINSDFSTIIKKVNLNNNNLNLSSLGQNLNDTRLLFGIQNLNNLHPSGLILEDEINPTYYIRNNSDENFLSFNFTYENSIEENSKLKITPNTVGRLIAPNAYGEYNISITSIPNSATAYFNGYNFNRNFTVFSAKIKDDFYVERGDMIDLKTTQNNTATENSNIEIKGLGTNYSIIYENASTNQITSTIPGNEFHNYVRLSISKNTMTRDLTLEFIVKDTIKPVLKLIGSEHMLTSQNKDFVDPGLIAYDPLTIGAESGDPIDYSSDIITSLDISTLGDYIITYSATDQSNNTTTITRRVKVIERAFDRILLTSSVTTAKEGEDITLIVQPDFGTPIANYENITYYWYLDNTEFRSTKADKNGKSIIGILAEEAKNKTISVKVVAKEKESQIQIILYSNDINLEIHSAFKNNDTIILASAIAVVIIIITVCIIIIVKYKKGKDKTHIKHRHKIIKPKKLEEKKSYGPYDSIQVIKNYGTPKNNPQTLESLQNNNDQNKQ